MISVVNMLAAMATLYIYQCHVERGRFILYTKHVVHSIYTRFIPYTFVSVSNFVLL